MTFILVHVTHKNMEDAEKISNILLEKRIVASVNYIPIKSSYWWKWSVSNWDEVITLFDTKKENREVVKKEILKNHPYETPCIMKIEVEANEDYENRIKKETV